MIRILLAFALLSLIATLSACTSQAVRDPPTRVVVPTPIAGVSVPIADRRSERSKLNRLSPGDHPTTFLGDSTFVPGPIQILGAHLEKGLPAAYRGAQIELTRFDVGLVESSCSSSAARSGSTAAGIPAGAAGYLVNALFAAAACSATDRGAGAYADVAIRVNDVEFIGVDFVKLIGLTNEEAIVRAISNAVHLLVQELAHRS